MPRRHSTAFARVLVPTLAFLFAPPIATAADATRGAALYESRCGSCHSESVHGRAKRVAKDFDDVRAWVRRWNGNLSFGWGETEIDDVTMYLNNTYYKYPCPPSVCKVVSLAPRAHGRLPG